MNSRSTRHIPDPVYSQNLDGYGYTNHVAQLNQHEGTRLEKNFCVKKEMCLTISEESTSVPPVSKVDAATMTDPLRIDLRLTSEYLERCSNALGIPHDSKYNEFSNNSSNQSHQDIKPTLYYDLQPQIINGMKIMFKKIKD